MCFLIRSLRYAKHYMEEGQAKRTLIKVFGIRIDIIVQSLVRFWFSVAIYVFETPVWILNDIFIFVKL